MKTYIVNVMEVWIQRVRVQANSEEEAKEKAFAGDSEILYPATQTDHNYYKCLEDNGEHYTDWEVNFEKEGE